ncbi:Uncharacterised protein [Bordetella pertussis]|nr:Uncharacterised protein [Bordetella pertussis]
MDPYCCSEERGSLFQESIKLHNFVIAAIPILKTLGGKLVFESSRP